LISSRVILTAGSCVARSTSTQVILGAHEAAVTEQSQQRRTVLLSGHRVHEQYNSANFNNDIATLIMSPSVTLNQFVQSIALPATIETFTGEVGTAIGRGRTSDSSSTSSRPRSVNMNIITNAQCSVVYGAMIVGSTLCTSGSGGRGICGGDNGSPLVVTRTGTRFLVGIASFFDRNGCAIGSPSGFTRVSSYQQWINNNTS
jgi:secreted trypsin-like serine protease